MTLLIHSTSTIRIGSCSRVTNTFVYRAVEDDECLVNKVVVTEMTKSFDAPLYDQITARVVDDTEWADSDCNGIGDGDPLEVTQDWYAQDDFGHIWYFGEETVDEEGSTEGSWEAGKDVADVGSLAEPGIVMLAHPDVSTADSVLADSGLFYEQEFYEDEAEDTGKVEAAKCQSCFRDGKQPGYQGIRRLFADQGMDGVGAGSS